MILKNVRKAFGYPFLLFHYFAYFKANEMIKRLIDSDVYEMNKRKKKNETLLYFLLFHKYYRNLFYHRIGGKKALLLNIILPSEKSFIIGVKEGIGANPYVLNHPMGTILHAKRIGSHFTCSSLTTLGNGMHGRNDLLPTIGDNVSLGVNVTIIGDITIGNNVIVGAASVVVKDIPDNVVVAGNPAKIIRKL